MPCAIQLGPFSDELLIAAETAEGPLVGFVKKANIQAADEDHGFVTGSAIRVEDDSVVRVAGRSGKR